MPLVKTLSAKKSLCWCRICHCNGDFFGNLRKKKRSPGYNPNLGGQIKKAGDFDSDIIHSALKKIISSRVSKARGQTFSDVRDFGSKLY